MSAEARASGGVDADITPLSSAAALALRQNSARRIKSNAAHMHAGDLQAGIGALHNRPLIPVPISELITSAFLPQGSLD